VGLTISCYKKCFVEKLLKTKKRLRPTKGCVGRRRRKRRRRRRKEK
jgi:hypothetical protein